MSGHCLPQRVRPANLRRLAASPRRGRDGQGLRPCFFDVRKLKHLSLHLSRCEKKNCVSVNVCCQTGVLEQHSGYVHMSRHVSFHQLQPGECVFLFLPIPPRGFARSTAKRSALGWTAILPVQPIPADPEATRALQGMLDFLPHHTRVPSHAAGNASHTVSPVSHHS